jgi:uncharacterized protein (DUF2062 family)
MQYSRFPALRLTMPRKFLRKYIPDADAMRSWRIVTLFGSWLQHPNLWHFNRRSVPGALAIGLFAGLLPGPVQMLAALLLAALWKKNIPVALVTTFYTNPLTIVPLYVIGFEYGNLILGRKHGFGGIEPFVMNWSDWLGSMHAMAHWCLSLGKPLAVGLTALALTLAAVGYLLARLGWRLYVVAAWRARVRRRDGRASRAE